MKTSSNWGACTNRTNKLDEPANFKVPETYGTLQCRLLPMETSLLVSIPKEVSITVHGADTNKEDESAPVSLVPTENPIFLVWQTLYLNWDCLFFASNLWRQSPQWNSPLNLRVSLSWTAVHQPIKWWLSTARLSYLCFSWCYVKIEKQRGEFKLYRPSKITWLA